jgi:hypothetical protein
MAMRIAECGMKTQNNTNKEAAGNTSGQMFHRGSLRAGESLYELPFTNSIAYENQGLGISI